MNKKRILKAIILMMLIALLAPMISLAANETETSKVTVYTKTNTDIFNLGENVKTEISWEWLFNETYSHANTQAISFTLQYDESKLEFIGGEVEEVTEQSVVKTIPLEEDYYNSETPGTLRVSIASFNNLNMCGININFKTKAIGEANIKLMDVDCMSNENLVSPDEIDFATNSLATIKTVAFGEINNDGLVNAADAVLIAEYLEGKTTLNNDQLVNADVNLDGIIDNIDVDLISKKDAGLITLPIRYGDIDLDGKVTIKDRVKLSRYLEGLDEVELTKQALINADVNMDGTVNEIDKIVIRQHIANDIKIPFKMIKDTNLKAIDREEFHIVTGFNATNLKVSDLLESFNTSKGCKVCNRKDEALENDAIVGTGTKIKLGGDGNNSLGEENGNEYYWMGEYNVVIYGDTTGDGKINAIDALAVIKDINNKIPFANEIYKTAGKVHSNVEDELTAIDALAIIKSINGKYEINQSK